MGNLVFDLAEPLLNDSKATLDAVDLSLNRPKSLRKPPVPAGARKALEVLRDNDEWLKCLS